MNFADILKIMHPLRQRVANMVARGNLERVDDAKKMQLVQLSLLESETRDEVERVQNYGFTSVPEQGAEAAVVFVGGKRDHGLVVAIDDRRYRVKNLESGEVAVYDKSGSKIVLKANGDIELTPSSGKVKLTGDLEVSGAVAVAGDIDSDATITGATDVVGGGKSLKTHTHGPGSLSVTTTGAAGGPSSVNAGSTGAPS